MTLKVLIVDDMATYRSIISRCMTQLDSVEVVGKVSNGKKALDFIEKNEVDLITLDVEMPIMDGLATLKELRKRRVRTEVIMLSGLSDQAAQLTIQCLELGALDFVLKPQSDSFLANQNQLVSNLKEIIDNLKGRRRFSFSTPTPSKPKAKPAARTAPASTTTTSATERLKQRNARMNSTINKAAVTRQAARKTRFALSRPKAMFIGISTGGPKALSEVFDTLKGPLPFPIFIVQHMPATFTRSLAESLNKKSNIDVVEAQDGDVVQNNTVYIAPGGYHMILLKDEDFGMVIGTNKDKPVHSCRPSADVLFMSAAKFYKAGELICLVMTGMGRDGADGAKVLHEKGAYVISQSEDTCTIYGMPKAVEDMGIQDEVLDLQDIAPFIMKAGKSSSIPRRR